MRCLIFDLAACTRPKVQMMQRSRLLSCSNVHDVEPCAFFLACRAVSWRALGILGRRACILSSPSHFCHCASTRSIRNRSSAYIPSLSRRTAPSDSKTQRFLFALSFVRFHPTGARESLRVAAGCTPGPSPCTPPEHMPRHWFALRHRHNLSNTHRRPSPHRPPSSRSSSRREYGASADPDESTIRQAQTVFAPYSVRPEPLPHAPAEGSHRGPTRRRSRVTGVKTHPIHPCTLTSIIVFLQAF